MTACPAQCPWTGPLKISVPDRMCLYLPPGNSVFWKERRLQLCCILALCLKIVNTQSGARLPHVVEFEISSPFTSCVRGTLLFVTHHKYDDEAAKTKIRSSADHALKISGGSYISYLLRSFSFPLTPRSSCFFSKRECQARMIVAAEVEINAASFRAMCLWPALVFHKLLQVPVDVCRRSPARSEVSKLSYGILMDSAPRSKN
jgi:hypothetical protein